MTLNLDAFLRNGLLYLPLLLIGLLGLVNRARNPLLNSTQDLSLAFIAMFLMVGFTMKILIPTRGDSTYDFYFTAFCCFVWSVSLWIKPPHFAVKARGGLTLSFLCLTGQTAITAFRFDYGWSSDLYRFAFVALCLLGLLSLATAAHFSRMKTTMKLAIAFIPLELLLYYLES